MKKSRIVVSVLIVLILNVCLLVGCNTTENPSIKELKYNNVALDFGNITLTNLSKPENLNSMQDFTDFIDYCVFYGDSDEMQYTTLSQEYLDIVKQDVFYQYRWAGQYASLGHNFTYGYDDSKLDENKIGINAGFVPYAFKSYDLSENNIKVVNYEYYKDTILNENNRGYNLKDFELYKHNKGFVEVNNSDQMFYAAMQGYMPVPTTNNTQSMLSMVLGILNRLLDENMSTYDKVYRIYNYLVCENTYDYESLHFKDSPHTDYEAYFLEGVFNGKNAVCDGIAKAMVLMCRLEGIEAYHIGAVGYRGGHAYTYINVDGTYYLCCPTQASFVQKENGKRYHCHTYSYMLTDYYTSSPDWDFYSEQLPEIGEKIKSTPKYDYWTNYKLEIGGKEYNLAPTNKESLVAILNEVGTVAQKSNRTMQIEILCNYDVANDAFDIIKDKYDVIKINNGMFEGQKLYAFVFGVK